ncbi:MULTISPECIES: hypothetical protein [Rhodococcus]|uniref:hypothetical protein n=1 Tax=Rhodococcus TaxID=1827 RepID=UPI0008304877|nr:hypothetical protein [Rhodococcus phenolicus]
MSTTGGTNNATFDHRAGSGHGGHGGHRRADRCRAGQAATGGDYFDSGWTESTIDLGVEGQVLMLETGK